MLITVGQLSKGFRLPGAELQVIAEPDVFEEERAKVERKGDRHRSIAKTFLSDLRDLKVGDLVVHVDHGIGQFVGLKQIGVGDSMQEFMELRYAGEDKLFVPVERLDLVQKYSGTAKPPLDKLGGTSWERAKTRVKKAMRDMAEELLKLYAARKDGSRPRVQPGFALAARVRRRVRVGADGRSGECHHRHQARHGVADADGPPALRRRRLRQDRSRDARRVQGGDGRQAGGVSRADDRAGVSASEDADRAVRRLSGRRSTWSAASAARPSRIRSSRISPPARSTSSSARTGCCRRTSSSRISACWSSTKSSASAWRTRSASSRCAARSTC